MRVSGIVRALHVTACRRSASFFELYGRTPEPKTDEKENTNKTPALSCSTAGHDKDWETCHAALQRFQTQRYIDPNHIPAELPRDALASVAAVLMTSPLRRSAAALGLWKEALELRAHTPAVDIAAATDTATVLLCLGKSALGYETCARLLRHNMSFRHRIETSEAELEDALRFLSVFAVCAAADDRHDIEADYLPFFETALQNAKSVIAGADKSKRSGPAHAVELLAWSLDWCYGDTFNGEHERDAAEALRSLLPQWLLFLFEPFDSAAAQQSTSSFALLSPRWLCEMARRAGDAGDHAHVERLLRYAQRKEATTPSYRIFQLSTRMVDVLVRRFPHLPAATQAVATYGTALHSDALRRFGMTKGGFEAALAVLRTMAGAEPYFVLRTLMRHHSVETAAAVQETVGDVLTGNPQLNWRTALHFTMHEVETANPNWRVYLPETLRLLSDGGQMRHFWSLLQEYNAADGASNVSVAASLAQAMSRSGRWWHAMEVMDLLASAPPPRNLAEESFLNAACTDTLRALLQSRRWQEALEVLELVGDAVPAHEVGVVSQLLMSLPAEAPWRSALQLAEQKGFAVHNAAAVLRVLHDGSASPLQLTAPQQRVAVPVFVQHGRWAFTRALVEQRPGDVRLWRGLLQALERCSDVVDEAAGAFLLSSVPASLADDPCTFCAVVQLFLQHGWYGLLATHLRAVAASAPPSLSSLCKEYQLLLAYLQDATRPPLTHVFTDSYVIHQFIACVAAQHLAVVAQLPGEAAMSKQQVSVYLRVPHDNLGVLRHRGSSGVAASSVKVYTTAASAFLLEHVLHIGADGFLFGYKVPGVSLYSAARGLTQTLQLPGVYLLAYNMSAASSGVFVLHPAVVSPRLYLFTLYVRLCLACLADAPCVPLLATTFFKRYDVVWHNGTTGRHEVTAAVPVESGFEVKTALRTLKMDINAEGWGLVETEPGAGDLYHINAVRYVPRAADGQTCADVQVVTCGQRSLKPINAEADMGSWLLEP